MRSDYTFELQELLESKKVRIIAGGGGRKPKLSLKEQIILTLVYLRHLTTFELLGIQFGVSESTANDTFNYWLPILRELLPSSLIEQVKKNESDLMVVKEILTDYELIVDSYEQVRERPGDNKEQEKYKRQRRWRSQTMQCNVVIHRMNSPWIEFSQILNVVNNHSLVVRCRLQKQTGQTM
ncbi:transposase family protein [Nostoc sp. CHAB 5784]|uniref:helix-turn-helix domain-containing protein n=1 Tax=Nostoc mirabile TaxID=2907820 RepID=UPI001E4F1659|nr:transposase family protein [Nostoc mirabile]MCC5668266.1 transposase family protein [Nostoc mirabile CHAB5784]